MKKTLSNILTVMLALLMALYVFPYEVIATMPDATEPEEYDTSVLDESVFEEDDNSKKEAYILFEDTEQRDENTKVFRMSDGSYTAAVYPMQVHFEENGEMREINNQFVLKTDEDGEMYYENTASPVKITLPAGLSEDNSVTYSKDEYSVSFSLSEMKFSGGISKINSDDTEYKNKLKKKIIADNTDDEDYIEKYGLSKEEAELIDVPYDVAVERLNTAEQELENIKCNVFYSNIFDDIDLRYSVVGTTLKDEIILNSRAATVKSYEFTITTTGLTAMLSEDNSVSLLNSAGEEVFSINTPYMYDAVGATSEDIKVTLKDNKNGTYTYKLKPDKKWLESNERVYPVTIDPPVTESNYDTVKDTTAIYANNVYTLNNASEVNYIKVGKKQLTSSSGKVELQGMLYNEIPEPLKNGSVRIIRADMVLYGHVGFTAYNKDLQINAYRITNDWNTDNVEENSAIALGSTPNYFNDVLDYVIVNDSIAFNECPITFNITEAAQEWMDGISPNYGIALRASGLSDEINYVHFVDSTNKSKSGFCPQFIYEYRDSRGIEDYWSFTSVNAGRFGTAAVNNFNGNLVIRQELVTGCGNNMPVSVYLTYSHNAPYEQNSGFGEWRTNYHMSVTARGIDDYPYYFTDADGTRFYLKKDGDEYKDEDGRGLTMTIPNGDYKYQITDKDKTVYYFDYNGRLKRIVDSNGNYNHIYYASEDTGTTDNRITEIREGSKMADSYQAATFTYDKEKVIVRTINNNSITTVGFISETNRQLKAIYYEDYDPNKTNDHVTRFDYDELDVDNDGEIETYYPKYIYDGLGHKVTIRSPKVNGIFRTTTLAWGSTSHILEQYDFIYSHNATKIIDTDRNEYTYQFNNYGQTIGVVNHTTSVGQSYEYGKQDGNSKGYENKLLLSSKTISPSSNRVKSSAFVSATDINQYTVSSANSITKEFYDDYGNTGTGSLKLSKTAAADTDILVYQEINGLSTGNYTLSLFVSTKGANLSGTGVKAAINVFKNGAFRTSSGSGFVTHTDDGEWIRLQTTIKIEAGDTHVNVGVMFDNDTTGCIYVDDIQFEYNISGGASNTDISGAGSYNLLTNAHFLNGTLTNWGGSGFTGSTDSTGAPRAVRNVANTTGDVKSQRNLAQTVYVDGISGDSFIAGCWIKANSLPLEANPYKKHTPQAGLYILFYNGNDKVGETVSININTGTEDWQYLTLRAIAPGQYTKVVYRLTYSYNTGTATVATPFLFKESYGQSYTYDDNGNLVSSTDAAESMAQFAYENDQLSSSLTPTGSRYIYAYNNSNDNVYALSNAGQRIDNSFNLSGDITSMIITDEKTVAPSKLYELTNSCYIVNAKTGRALSLYADETVPGNGVGVFTRNHYRVDYQRWWLYVLDEGKNIYTIRTAVNNQYGLNTSSDTTHTLKSLTGGTGDPASAKFCFMKNFDDTYCIVSEKDEGTKYLSDSGKETGTNTGAYQVYADNNFDGDDPAYKWIILTPSTSLKMRSDSEYSSDGRYLTKAVDQSGYSTSYSYNDSGLLKTSIDAKNNVINYTYDNMDNITEIKGTINTTDDANVKYTYADGQLDTISVDEEQVKYKFTYDEYGRTTSIGIDDSQYVPFEQYVYMGQNLTSTIYGNQDSVSYTYDALDRVLSKKYNDNVGTVYYNYDPNGNLYETVDGMSGTRTTIEYDLANRVSSVMLTSQDKSKLLAYQGIRYNDKKGTVKSMHHAIFDDTNAMIRNVGYTYTYGDPSFGQMPDMLYKMTVGLRSIDFTYDVLGRLIKRTMSTTNPVTESYTYKNAEYRPGYTTTLVDTMTDYTGAVHSYTYDALGNITSETVGNNTITYQYDSLNRLIRVNDPNKDTTYLYTYDDRGNILKKQICPYSDTDFVDTLTGNVYYTYDSVYKDKLATYNGVSIGYDNSGNPTTWINGETLTWSNGKNLTAVIKSGITTNYMYNGDGLRTAKTGGRSTQYYLLDGTYAGEKTVIGNKTYYISYLYDENGSPLGINRNGTAYYFAKNMQGDVIAILDVSGSVVARYSYDAWGAIFSVTDASGNSITDPKNIANCNPFRYRGYMYDQETGLYYVNSRYYDAVVGRWLNADVPDVLAAGFENIGQYNLYAYCFNDPVNMSDETGTWPSWATKLIIGTAVIAAAAVLTVATAGSGTAIACFAVGALKGAAIGAAVGAASGAATGAVGHRLTTGSWEGAGNAAIEGAADGYMTGAITGFVSGGLSSNVCFVAGTSVLTSTGKVAIETIEPGYLVYATNPETGETALKQVVQTFVNETTELVHVYVNGEELITTPGHLFYVVYKGWIGADKLQCGDRVYLYSTQQVTVENIVIESLKIPVNVYNFEVEDFHTYYVGENSLLVHNKGCGIDKISDKYLKKLKLDAHSIKQEYLGRKAKISLYDLAVDKKTGIIYIINKAGEIVAETIYKTK